MSALGAVALLDEVTDWYEVTVCSVQARERTWDAEGPETRAGSRPFVSVVEVRLHVLDVTGAQHLADILGLAVTNREVHDFTSAGLDAREHITWSALIADPSLMFGAPGLDGTLLFVEVLAIGPAPEVPGVPVSLGEVA